MSMTKETIIFYLQDPEIQEELRKVLQPEQPHPVQGNSQITQATEPLEQPPHEEEDELISLKAMYDDLKCRLTGTEQALAQEKQALAREQQECGRKHEENQRLQQENASNQQKYQQDMSSLKSQAEQNIGTLQQQAQREKETLLGQISQLQEEVHKKSSQISGLEEDVREKSSQISGLEGELTSARGVISKFEAEQVSFRLYQSLSSSTKSELIRVFHQETFENFIACCAQKDTAEALWMFTKTRIFDGNMEEVSQLADIFRFSLACHNSTSETPSLHLVEGKVGERFDSEIHLGTPQSKKAGTVQTMHFAGYAVGRDKKIKQKSIVIVE